MPLSEAPRRALGWRHYLARLRLVCSVFKQAQRNLLQQMEAKLSKPKRNRAGVLHAPRGDGMAAADRIVIASLTPAVLTAGHRLARGARVYPGLCFSFVGMVLALATFSSVFEISQAGSPGWTSSVRIVA